MDIHTYLTENYNEQTECQKEMLQNIYYIKMSGKLVDPACNFLEMQERRNLQNFWDQVEFQNKKTIAILKQNNCGHLHVIFSGWDLLALPPGGRKKAQPPSKAPY